MKEARNEEKKTLAPDASFGPCDCVGVMALHHALGHGDQD